MAVPSLLSVRNLVVELPARRGVLRPVDGVSIDLAPGEILGLVGESGAGKSLTGAAIIRLLDPPGRIASGEVWLEGRRIDSLPEPDLRRIRGRRVGMIFQDPSTALDPLMPIGRQLVETIRTHLDISFADARVRAVELLTQVGIPAAGERFEAYPHAFSGGMRQRVVIALALAAGPSLVIADEPTTALDVSVQAQVLDVLRQMCRKRNVGMILITHDMGVIAETADRVAVMYAGRIVESGPVADVLASPRHPYTRGLMGSIPSLGSASARLAHIPGAMPRLDEIPAGCAFALRCDLAFDRCRKERPALEGDRSGSVACWSELDRGIPPVDASKGLPA